MTNVAKYDGRSRLPTGSSVDGRDDDLEREQRVRITPNGVCTITWSTKWLCEYSYIVGSYNGKVDPETTALVLVRRRRAHGRLHFAAESAKRGTNVTNSRTAYVRSVDGLILPSEWDRNSPIYSMMSFEFCRFPRFIRFLLHSYTQLSIL